MLKPPREHARDAHERTRLVLDEHGERVSRLDHFSFLVLDEIERGGAGRDHREAVLADRLARRRPPSARTSASSRCSRLVLALDGEPHRAIGLGELRVVRDVVCQMDLSEKRSSKNMSCHWRTMPR